MPDASLFKDGQSLRVHLLYRMGLGIRWEGASVKMLFSVRVTAVADCGGSSTSEVGGGVDGPGSETGSGVLLISSSNTTFQMVMALTSTPCMLLLID